MNDTFIKYVEEMLDIAEQNNIFCLTPRAFNEFSTEVREALEKQIPRKVDTEISEIGEHSTFVKLAVSLRDICMNIARTVARNWIGRNER